MTFKTVASTSKTILDITDAYSAVLTNEAQTIACDKDGTALTGEIGSTGKAKSSILVYKGATSLTGVASSPGLNQFSYSVGTQTGCTAKRTNDSSFYIETISADSGSVAIDINVEGDVTISKVYTFTKSKTGATGATGPGALTIVLSNESATIPTDKDGNNGVYTTSGTDIYLYEGVTALAYDGVGTSNGTWKISAAGTGITASSTFTDQGNYVTVGSHSNMTTDTASIVYTITGKRADGTAISLTKTQTFAKSKTGATGGTGATGVAALTILLTNESTTITTDKDGNNGIYTTSGTDIYLYEGTTPLAYDGVGTSNGTWKVTAAGTGITASSTFGDQGNFVTVGSHSNMTTDTASVVYTITGKRADGTAISLAKTQTFAKSKTGATGATGATGGTGATGPGALTIVLTNESTTIATDKDGNNGIYTTSGTDIYLYEGTTALAYDGVGASNGTWKVTAAGTGITASSTFTDQGNYVTVGSHSNMTLDAASVVYTIAGKRADGTAISLTKSQTFAKSKTGATGGIGATGVAALSLVLSNEGHTIPTDKDGNNGIYTGSGTDIYLYEGTTPLAYDGVGTSNGTWKVSATSSNITASTTFTDQGNYVTVGQHSNMTADTATVTYTITGKRADGTAVSLTKTQTFSKVKTGATGGQGPTGATGDSVFIEYSVDGSTNWHTTYAAGDVYMHQKIGTGGTWTSAIKILGSDGKAMEVEYSVSGTSSWHSTFTAGDLYMHQRIAGGVWSSAIKIVGTDANLLTWVSNWNDGVVTISNKQVITPRLFAGSNAGTSAAPNLTGIAIGTDVLGGTNTTIGIVGYASNTSTFKLNTDGSAVFGSTPGQQLIVNTDGSIDTPIITADKIRGGALQLGGTEGGIGGAGSGQIYNEWGDLVTTFDYQGTRIKFYEHNDPETLLPQNEVPFMVSSAATGEPVMTFSEEGNLLLGGGLLAQNTDDTITDNDEVLMRRKFLSFHKFTFDYNQLQNPSSDHYVDLAVRQDAPSLRLTSSTGKKMVTNQTIGHLIRKTTLNGQELIPLSDRLAPFFSVNAIIKIGYPLTTTVNGQTVPVLDANGYLQFDPNLPTYVQGSDYVLKTVAASGSNYAKYYVDWSIANTTYGANAAAHQPQNSVQYMIAYSYNAASSTGSNTINGYVDIGIKDANAAYFETDRAVFSFNKDIRLEKGYALKGKFDDGTNSTYYNAIYVANSIAIGGPEGAYWSGLTLGSGNGALSLGSSGGNSQPIQFGSYISTTFNEKMRLTYDGKLGIGTTVPTVTLNVMNNLNTSAENWVTVLQNNNAEANTPTVGLLFAVGDNNSQKGGIIFRRTSAYGVGDMYFLNNNTADATKPTIASNMAMVIKSDGKIGIGTATPATKLHVYGSGVKVEGGDLFLADTNGQTPYQIKSFSNGSSLWLMNGSGSASSIVVGTALNWDVGIAVDYTPGTVGAAAGVLKIGQIQKNNANYTHGVTALYTNGFERMRIINDGSVGIGTTAPSKLLDVNGTSIFRGVITSRTQISVNTANTDTQSSVIVGVPGASNYFTGSAVGDLVLRNEANTNILLGFSGPSGSENPALKLGYNGGAAKATVSTQRNTLDDGAGNMTVNGTVSHKGLTMTAGTNIDQIYTVTDSLTLTTTWQDTSVNAAELATGTYIVQVYANDYAVGGGQYDQYYSGVMSWFASNTNDGTSDEIALHRAGHAPNTGTIYLRILRTVSADVADLKLQIAGDTANTGASNYIYKFRRMI